MILWGGSKPWQLWELAGNRGWGVLIEAKYITIFELLMKELLALEQGVLAEDGSVLKASLVVHTSDNLEAMFYTK